MKVKLVTIQRLKRTWAHCAIHGNCSCEVWLTGLDELRVVLQKAAEKVKQ